MIQPSSNFGHSAEVDLRLIVGDREISLHAVGPEQVTLREPTSAPPGPAEVIVRLDGREHRTRVTLPDGLRADCKAARIVPETPPRRDAEQAQRATAEVPIARAEFSA